jgi:hypothetical protein
MFLIHQTHEPKIFFRLRNGIVVHVAAMKTEQTALLAHAELRMIEVDPRPGFTH